MLDMLYTLSKSHSPGRKFRPVSIDYRNMERMLNIQSLGIICLSTQKCYFFIKYESFYFYCREYEQTVCKLASI